jgi:nucleoside-specific outer membrane channel protein Tsx
MIYRKENELIARFMGWKPSVMEGDGGINLMYFPDSSKQHVYQCQQRDVAGMKYHCSWTWLMPVVTKIEHLFDGYLDFTIGSDFVQVSSFQTDYKYRREHEVDDKLDAVYKAVVEFIKWYNKLEPHERIFN